MSIGEGLALVARCGGGIAPVLKQLDSKDR
jgi:hypothetical protein